MVMIYVLIGFDILMKIALHDCHLGPIVHILGGILVLSLLLELLFILTRGPVYFNFALYLVSLLTHLDCALIFLHKL